MVFSVFFPTESTVVVPRTLNADTMFTFVEGVIDAQRNAKASKIIFDFGNLDFIEPVGVVILSNLIEYLRRWGAKVTFKGHTGQTTAIKFLDDSQFFQHYLKKQVFPTSSIRPTTVPLNLIGNDRSQEYLLYKLMPWMGGIVGMPPDDLSGVKTSLEEILHNVNDHSGVDFGCTFAQYFPNRNTIQIAISDFGRGIPDLVRTQVPGLSDAQALRLACQEGFTTKSNVRNRGAGLPTLIRYVTQQNGGNVMLVAGEGVLTASPDSSRKTKMTPKRARGSYPGTLVRVILRTDGLERAAEDAEIEPFQW